MDLLELALSYFPQTQTDRRVLHQHPELSFEEYKTSEYAATRLKQQGFTIGASLAETGFVASFDTGRRGPSFLFRFDMDALPVYEENEVDYCSTVPGKMHACGHDGHVAIGLTIGWMINQLRDQLVGSYHLLFQPAEEIGQGALRMLDEGALVGLGLDYLLSAHLWNEKPFGWVGVTPGAVMAASGKFEIIVMGKGGHGGQPQSSIDPIVAAAQIVNEIQTIVSRNLNPLNPAVISVCSISGGKTFNITPSKVEMGGTIRYFSDESYQVIARRLKDICEHSGYAMGCQVQLTLEPKTKATINDPQVADAVRQAAIRIGNETAWKPIAPMKLDTTYKTMLSEDVGVFLEQVPGCFVLVGAGDSPDGNQFPHHHPRFNFDERAMPLTAALLLQTCLQLAAS